MQRNVVLVERGRVDLEDTARMPERPDRVPDARGPAQPDGAKELCARLLVERLVLAGSGVTARRSVDHVLGGLYAVAGDLGEQARAAQPVRRDDCDTAVSREVDDPL